MGLGFKVDLGCSVTGFIGCIGFMVLWGLGTIWFSGLQGLGLRAGVLSEPFSRLRGPELFTKISYTLNPKAKPLNPKPSKKGDLFSPR